MQFSKKIKIYLQILCHCWCSSLESATRSLQCGAVYRLELEIENFFLPVTPSHWQTPYIESTEPVPF